MITQGATGAVASLSAGMWPQQQEFPVHLFSAGTALQPGGQHRTAGCLSFGKDTKGAEYAECTGEKKQLCRFM